MLFVAPDQVEDALTGGFEFYRPLEGSFARAVFMMFLIAEAHPVVDGNGRTARIMMHAELVSAGEIRLIIPTDIEKPCGCFRRTAGATRSPECWVFAQRYTGTIPFASCDLANSSLKRTNAFVHSNEADSEGKKTRMSERP